MKHWLSGCDDMMKIRMDGGAVRVQIEWQCRLVMLLINANKWVSKNMGVFCPYNFCVMEESENSNRSAEFITDAAGFIDTSKADMFNPAISNYARHLIFAAGPQYATHRKK